MAVKMSARVRRRRNLLFGIGALALALCMVIGLQFAAASVRAQREQARREAAALEQSNDKLQSQIGALGSQDSVDDIAREELGMVDPTTVIIIPGK